MLAPQPMPDRERGASRRRPIAQPARRREGSVDARQILRFEHVTLEKLTDDDPKSLVNQRLGGDQKRKRDCEPNVRVEVRDEWEPAPPAALPAAAVARPQGAGRRLAVRRVLENDGQRCRQANAVIGREREIRLQPRAQRSAQATITLGLMIFAAGGPVLEEEAAVSTEKPSGFV